jgi:hypothetical protein
VVAQFATELRPALSPERFEAYRPQNGSVVEMIVNYLYNLVLSEALYSPHCCLEITLRNTLNANLRHHLGTPTWYNQPGLLSGSYEAPLWRPRRAQLLKDCFQHIPRPLRQRGTIYYRHNRLRELRNRVMHHEPVWNRPTLLQDYRDIVEAITWINPRAAEALRLIDRFEDVYQNDRARIERTISARYGTA